MDDLLSAYFELHDMLSDMIEGGRLTEGDIPDDYAALVEQLEQCNAYYEEVKRGSNLDSIRARFVRELEMKEG